MRSITWNRFPIKDLLIDCLLTSHVESSYLYTDMCKFESSQKDGSSASSVASPKIWEGPKKLGVQNAW